MKNITVSVPAEPGLLLEAAKFLAACEREVGENIGLYRDNDSTLHAPVTVFATESPDTPQQSTPVEAEKPKDEAQPEGTVDHTGLPWDERIHSSGRTFLAKTVAKGTPEWKKKRGVSDEYVAKIEAEIRSEWKKKRGVSDEHVAKTEAEIRSAGPLPAPATPPTHPQDPQPNTVQTPVAPASAPPAPPQADPVPTQTVEFPALFAKGMQVWGQNSMTNLNALALKFGLTDTDGNGSIALAAPHPQLIQSIFAEIK